MLVKLEGPAASLVRNTGGEFSLQGTMGLIEKASLMITNDSGLYHIATSFGVPVISLWGPVSPHHYADIRNSDDFIFYSQDIYCSPCVHRTHFPPCKGNNVCMKSIAPERVYKKACEILGLPASPDLVDMREIYENEGLSDLDIIIRGRPR